MEIRNVVTSFLTHAGKILVLRRSSKVGTNQGKWAGVSGHLESHEEPLERAKTEILEEVGLDAEQVVLLRAGEKLRAYDEVNSTVWVIHPFLFEILTERIHLDWEHTDSRWVTADEVAYLETTPKLRETLERVRWDLETPLHDLTDALTEIDEIANDRVHGASFLGRRALQVLGDVVQVSRAMRTEDLFRDLLALTLRLRAAQTGMATIYGLTGRLLQTAQQRTGCQEPIDTYRACVTKSIDNLTATASNDAEDAARNTSLLLPETGVVLTHSYSSNVRRAIELGKHAGRRFDVYVTESYPGLEGKQLAKDLVTAGITVRLIADSAAPTAVLASNLVLVGADSVLSDGAVVNKIGTKTLGECANTSHVPFYVVTESEKFSVPSLLGESVEYSDSLFDKTSAEHVTGIVTEKGTLRTADVESELKRMVREVYT